MWCEKLCKHIESDICDICGVCSCENHASQRTKRLEEERSADLGKSGLIFCPEKHVALNKATCSMCKYSGCRYNPDAIRKEEAREMERARERKEEQRMIREGYDMDRMRRFMGRL